jgi:3-oxoacyl-[acyl-carrier protein] reductase
MDLNLKAKTIVVSGGARGIGQHIAQQFLLEGANVAIADLDRKGGASLEAQLSRVYGDDRIRFIGCDVTNKNDVNRLFYEVLEKWGSVNVLVNSHQWWPFSWFQDITDEDWQRCIDVNLTSYFLLCRAAVKIFVDLGIKGKILNITSQAAFRGSTTGHAHYAAAKAGIVGLTMSVAREVAALGINVIGLAPGIVETPATQEILQKDRKSYESRIPLGRVARPDEIASVAVFLMSERASYITGATIDISGGILMR